MYIGQAEIAPCMFKGKPFVIKAHQMKNGCMHIMNMNLALFRKEPVIISCAMRVPTLNTTARKPHGGKPCNLLLLEGIIAGSL